MSKRPSQSARQELKNFNRGTTAAFAAAPRSSKRLRQCHSYRTPFLSLLGIELLLLLERGFDPLSDRAAEVANQLKGDLAASSAIGTGVGVADQAAVGGPPRSDPRDGRSAAALLAAEERLREQGPQDQSGRVDRILLSAEVELELLAGLDEEFLLDHLAQWQGFILHHRAGEQRKR